MLFEILYLNQIGILFFLCVICLIALYNLLTIKRVGTSLTQHNSPMVSILVPARNEAHNIEDCLSSLLSQDYRNYEVIVLDDESQDTTAEILQRLSCNNAILKVIPGQPLPSGWLGKNWACHQLSQVAEGELILFVDADTRHHPRMLQEAVSTFYATHADLLSGLPRQIMKTWGERLILPILAWAVFSFFPIHIFQRLPFSFLAIAVGQFILIRRTMYVQIGGHEAIRNSVIEDFSLVRLVKKNKLRWEFVDLAGYVHSRMYENVGQVIDGLSKNLYALFGYNLPVFIFIWLWLVIVFTQPALSLVLYIIGIKIPGFSPGLAVAAVAMSLISWLVSIWYSGMPLVQAIAFPLTMAMTVLIAIRSVWFHYMRSSSISWKGRTLNTL